MREWSGLVQVTTARACFGLIVRSGIVVDCAPYGARQSLRRPIDVVTRYWRANGASVKAIADDGSKRLRRDGRTADHLGRIDPGNPDQRPEGTR